MRTMTTAMIDSLPRVHGEGDHGVYVRYTDDEVSLFLYRSEDERDAADHDRVDVARWFPINRA